MISRICSIVNFGIESFKLIKKIFWDYILFFSKRFSAILNVLWKESRREKKGLSANMDKEYFDEIFLGRNGLMESKMADFGFGLKFELINK